MSQSASALTPDNQILSRGIRSFCEDRNISVRDLSDLCGGSQNKFGKTQAFRLYSGDATNDLADRMRPFIADAFVRLLETEGLSATEIDEELNKYFLTEEDFKMIADRCLLQPEVKRFFNLKCDPFDVDRVPEREERFSNDALDSIVSRLKDAIQYQRFVAVIGGVGTGKTLLKLRVADELWEETDNKVRLLYPEFFDFQELTVANIANAILHELGQVIPNDKARRVSKVKQVLTELQQDGISVAIIIDEAHRLHDKVISSFKNFWEMTNGRNARLLSVILFAQPSFVESRLRDTKFTEIRQRVQIVDMPKLNGSSRSYIEHRMQLAGREVTDLFDDAAIERICLNARTPLALGNLVNSALTAAYNVEEQKVTIDLPFFKTLSSGQQVLNMRRSA